MSRPHLPVRNPTTGRVGKPLVRVIQPYVPQYRVPFFIELAQQLDAAGMDLEVVHSSPWGESAERRDEAQLPWSRQVRQWRVSFGSRSLRWRRVHHLAVASSVVVAELASSNLETFALALDPRVRLVLWGHGRPYVTEDHWLDRLLERWLAQRAAHLLVYTASGKAAAVPRLRSPEDRVTVLHNSTDVQAVVNAAARSSDKDVEELRRKYGAGGQLLLFVGALDESKELPLLLATMDRLADRAPDIRLIVAGDGRLRDWLITEVTARPNVVLIGRVGADELARLGRACDAFLLTGRVGLVAVDAIAMGLPVILTDYPYHAPERDYLDASVSRTGVAEAEGLADTVISTLADTRWLVSARTQLVAQRGNLGVHRMAHAFTQSVQRVLSDAPGPS